MIQDCIFLTLIFICTGVIPNSAYGKSEKNCYFHGQANSKAVDGISDFASDAGGPGTDLQAVINKKCTVKELNTILKKFGTCIRFTMKRNPSLTLKVPIANDDKKLDALIEQMKKEKCLPVIMRTPPPPVPATN